MDLAREPLAANIEVKARLDRYDEALAVCRRLGAEDRGTCLQTDTYFSLGRYRLKLRESLPGEHLLIGYSRPDTADAKKSQYRVSRVGNPGATKAALEREWGTKVVVEKARHLFLWRGRVRIHLDRVTELGDFLEFEAVLGAEPGYDEETARIDVAALSREFGITARDLVAESYANLVRGGNAAPAGT